MNNMKTHVFGFLNFKKVFQGFVSVLIEQREMKYLIAQCFSGTWK